MSKNVNSMSHLELLKKWKFLAQDLLGEFRVVIIHITRVEKIHSESFDSKESGSTLSLARR